MLQIRVSPQVFCRCHCSFLLRECYSTPCNVRICLTGWMRSVSLRVVRVGGYFLEGSAKQSHSYHASARNKIYRGRQNVQI